MVITDFRVRSRLLIALLATAIVSTQLPTRAFAHSLQGPLNNYGSAAQVSEVTATVSTRGVLIEWRSGFRVDNLGFNIFRDRNGRREKINREIIAGSALIVRHGAESYSWLDPNGAIDCTYYLTDIDLYGNSTAYPATTPQFGSFSAGQQSELLSDLGARTSTPATQTEWSERSVSKSLSVSAQANTTNMSGEQWRIANQAALKIGVRADGLYRLTQSEMAGAGFDTAGDARNLRMFVNGAEVAIRVSRDSGALMPTDYIEFWGEGLDTPSTDTQIYWLVNGLEAGKRIVSVGELQSDFERESARVSIPFKTAVSNIPSGWFAGTSRLDWNRGAAASAIETEQISSSSSNSQAAQAYSPTIVPPGSPSAKDPLSKPGMASNSKNSLTAKTALSTDPEERYKDVVEGSAKPRTRTVSVRRTASFRRSSVARRSRQKKRPQGPSRVRSSRHRSHATRRHRHHPSLAATVAAPAFVYSVERKDRTVYFAAARNGPTENFFGQVVAGDPSPLTLSVHNVEDTSTLPAQLQVTLRGVTIQSHQVNVFLNGSLVGSLSFYGQETTTQALSLPLAALLEGDNTVKLTPIASGNDVSVVDYVRLTYPHRFQAHNDSLKFTIKSTQSPRIDGFTTQDIRAFDITDPAGVQELYPIIESSGGGFAATVPSGPKGKARRMVAVTGTQILHPVSLTLNQPSTLNLDVNAADLLIISYRDFIPALAPLVTQRRDRDGFIVKVVDVEDVYDEFSYGAHDAQSIKDFVFLASSKWSRPPRYLLLVGDASYDPRNYLKNGLWDLVPSMHVDTFYMEADSDDSLGDFDDDGAPELAIGRLPARSVSEANVIVSKIINFDPADVPNSALMVADYPVGYDFEAFNEHLITLLPTSMTVHRVYRSSDPTPRQNIIAKINQGVALVNYSGHGNIDIWAGSVFNSGDALTLNNGKRLPFLTVMDCLNGFFSDPLLEGIAESFLKAPNGGSVASFASSGLTGAISQHQMGERMFQLLYCSPSMAIGDVSRQAKSAAQDIDVRRTWILFGDPTMKFK